MKNFKKVSNKPLGELLIERGIITLQQLNEAIDYQKEKRGLIGEILVEKNFATEQDIAQALTCQYGFPYLPLTNYDVDEEVISSIPKDICIEFCLIPVDKIGKSLTIAMANPLNSKAAENIELITGCTVQAFVSTPADIKTCIDKYYK